MTNLFPADFLNSVISVVNDYFKLRIIQEIRIQSVNEKTGGCDFDIPLVINSTFSNLYFHYDYTICVFSPYDSIKLNEFRHRLTSDLVDHIKKQYQLQSSSTLNATSIMALSSDVTTSYMTTALKNLYERPKKRSKLLLLSN